MQKKKKIYTIFIDGSAMTEPPWGAKLFYSLEAAREAWKQLSLRYPRARVEVIEWDKDFLMKK